MEMSVCPKQDMGSMLPLDFETLRLKSTILRILFCFEDPAMSYS